MRILVIEDETQLARHINRALVRSGHMAQAKHDGVEGLAEALENPPDLVVLDLNLPRLDGFSVLTRLFAPGQRLPPVRSCSDPHRPRRGGAPGEGTEGRGR